MISYAAREKGLRDEEHYLSDTCMFMGHRWHIIHVHKVFRELFKAIGIYM